MSDPVNRSARPTPRVLNAYTTLAGCFGDAVHQDGEPLDPLNAPPARGGKAERAGLRRKKGKEEEKKKGGQPKDGPITDLSIACNRVHFGHGLGR